MNYITLVGMVAVMSVAAAAVLAALADADPSLNSSGK